MIRSTKTRRRLAWLGLFAIALIAIAPTISQVLARPVMAFADAAGSGDAAMAGGQHDKHHAGDHRSHAASGDTSLSTPAGTFCFHNHDGKSPDDCWKKCGYCDFLTHTPSLGGFEYVAVFAAGYPPTVTLRALTQRAHSLYVLAAQPRGPPAFLQAQPSV